MTTINGHTLTGSEMRTLNELRDYLHRNAGDSTASSITSPKGDGADFDVYQIFGRSNQATAHRRNVWTLYHAGVLRACEIDYGAAVNWRLKLKPFAEIAPPPEPAKALEYGAK